MQARPVAGDEPGDPVRYALALHVLMSEAEIALWASLADRLRLEVDEAVYAAALSGLKHQLAQDGDSTVHAARKGSANGDGIRPDTIARPDR